MMCKKNLALICFTLSINLVHAQDDLLEMLEEEQENQEQIVEATFKGTRLINGHTIKTRNAGTLDFIISHRFGVISSGAYELWGLDNANIRLGLEYAPTDRIYVGVGRSSFEKTYDGLIKIKALRQQSGAKNIPVSLAFFNSATIKTEKNPSVDKTFKDKLAYTSQVLIARKFSSKLSLQVMPTYVHLNLVEAGFERNDAFAIGVGGRYKLTQRFSVNSEYYYQVQSLAGFTKNAFAIGVDIETGGHVFQLQFTNATAMVEKGFIGETTNDFFAGDIHFGFNISRTFQLKKE